MKGFPLSILHRVTPSHLFLALSLLCPTVKTTGLSLGVSGRWLLLVLTCPSSLFLLFFLFVFLIPFRFIQKSYSCHFLLFSRSRSSLSSSLACEKRAGLRIGSLLPPLFLPHSCATSSLHEREREHKILFLPFYLSPFLHFSEKYRAFGPVFLLRTFPGRDRVYSLFMVPWLLFVFSPPQLACSLSLFSSLSFFSPFP